MTPDLQSSLLCDDVRQERNGKFILIGLFDGVGVPHFPVVLPRICLVNRWCSGEGGFTQRSRILKPDNTPLIEGKEVPVSLQDSEATATTVEFFINVQLEVEGTYWIEVQLNGNLKIRYPIKARQVAPPPGFKPPEGPMLA
jgi:hypothetical protein